MSRTSRSNIPPASQEIPHIVDWLILLVVVGVSVVSIGATFLSGAFSASLSADNVLSWHLVRAAGLTSYTLLAASTLWGLFLSSRILKNWSPGPLSLLLHVTVSWLAIVLAAAHAGLLVFDTYYNYTLKDLIVPFVGPYRPFAVGLGIAAAWLILAINISFGMRKLIGHRAWLWLHYTSYGAFALVTVHALLAGTDATKPGMMLILGVFTVVIVALLSWRLLQPKSRQKTKNAV
ncbi:MAG: hypothetical protein ABI947_01485 [Chloroflexota bacterium]